MSEDTVRRITTGVIMIFGLLLALWLRSIGFIHAYYCFWGVGC